MNYFLYVIPYICFFMILSERFTTEAFIVSLPAVFVVHHFFSPHRSWTGSLQNKRRIAGLWVLFVGILLKEIVKANVQVAAIVLSPSMTVSPRVTPYVTRLRSPKMMAALATAITLTPGTMTVDLKGQTFSIHCLNDWYAQGLENNPLEPILEKLEELSYE